MLPKHVWAIRVRLELAGATRDLALFNLAINSKIRECDLVRVKIAGVFTPGRMTELTTIRQSKTQTPVQLEVTKGTRLSLINWISDPAMYESAYRWQGRLHDRPHVSTRHWSRHSYCKPMFCVRHRLKVSNVPDADILRLRDKR